MRVSNHFENMEILEASFDLLFVNGFQEIKIRSKSISTTSSIQIN